MNPPKIYSIKYVDATLNQLSRAKVKMAKEKRYTKFPGYHSPEQILYKDKFDDYRTYQNNGHLTIVGKAKRLQDLIDKKLPETATVKEYLTKILENLVKDALKVINDVNKHMK